MVTLGIHKTGFGAFRSWYLRIICGLFVFVTFNSLLIRGDGGAFDADIVLQHGMSGVDRNLVLCGVAVRQAQVEIQTVQLTE